ncbi:MAG: type I 3-dehydroquinate dehydratase [Methanobacteriota archaeon]|nr:MAG: type I 3-dehydroquinate dehydratase [Euryarchaeota archaeon]
MALICASLAGERPEDILKAASGIEADLIEVRADRLTRCTREEVHSLVSELKKRASPGIILTVRSSDEGGSFKGSEEERRDIILGSLHLADMVDIELRAAIRDEIVEAARANGVEVIVSYHDFERTPSKEDITALFEEEAGAGADYAKAAFMARSPGDVLELLRAAEEASKRMRVVAISMGELGRISRIAAPIFGSRIVYAAAGEATAPGQLSLEDTAAILEALGVRG